MSNIVWVGCSSANFTVGRLGYKITGGIIHTVVGSLQSADASFANPARQASANYGVECDGSVIHQWVKESDIAWHCGRFYPSPPAQPLGNANTIGIEHCDGGQPYAPRSDGLYVASSRLVAEISQRYGFPIDRAHWRKHSEVSEAPTGCPDALDIDRIVHMAANGLYGGSGGTVTGDDDDMLYVGPLHAHIGNLPVFAATPAYHDPSSAALVLAQLVAGTSVSVSGYRYSSSAVSSSDRGAGAGAGPDLLWWKRSDGAWIPDAALDTSGVTGLPIGAALSTIPATEPQTTYFAVADVAVPSAPDDDSAYALKTHVHNVDASKTGPSV